MTKDLRVCFTLVLVVSLSHFVQKPFRDEAITIIGLEQFNWLLTGAFVVGIVLVLIFYTIKDHVRFWLPWVLFINSLFLFVQFIFSTHSREFLIAYCMLTSVLNLSMISLVSGIAMEALSVKAKENHVSKVYMGQAISAIIGPLICMIIPPVNASWVLVIASVLSVLGALLIRYVPAQPILRTNQVSHVLTLDVSIYRLMAHTFLYTLVSILFYYLLLYSISTSFPSQNRITAFAFAELGSSVLGLAAFWLFQRSSPWKKSDFLILPVFSILILIGVAFSQILSLSIAFIIFFKVIKNGVRSTDRDVALLTVAPATFVPAKNLLDTVVYRSGDLAGGWLIHWLAGSFKTIILASIFIAIIWLLFSIRLNNSKFIN